ncbi:MAG: hypothetical protein CK425_03145 [Parachlamydia sp.]|nr:MAG: hypothetical protein CK425_03145 [Parachlamydia sp.]
MEISNSKLCSHLDSFTEKFSFLLNHNFFIDSTDGLFSLKHSHELLDLQKALRVCHDFLSSSKKWAIEENTLNCIISIYALAIKPLLLFIEKRSENSPSLMDQCAELRKEYLTELRLFKKRQNQKPLVKEDAAIRLQRAYRLHQYWKSKKTSKTGANTVYSIPLNIAPPIPQKSNAVNQVAAKNWVLAHSVHWQPTARKILKNLIHRSFKKFEQRLKIAVESFNEKLMSLPLEERKYIVIIPGKKWNQKSNPWVTSLALKYLTIPPLDIVYENENSYQNDIKAVIFDDAAYSGKQLQGVLETTRFKNVHLIIPFISRTALSNISQAVWVSSHEKMFNISDMNEFSEEELNLLKSKTGDYYSEDLTKRTFNWFDHKIPDHLSTLDDILCFGKTLDKPSCQVPFIPETTPPYSVKWF